MTAARASISSAPAGVSPSMPPRAAGVASIVAALIIALGPLLWLWFALRRSGYLGFGPAQGAAQAVAFALAHGDRLGSGVRVDQGPLVYEIQLGLLRVFGADVRVLRVFDLVSAGLAAAFVGGAIARAATSGVAPALRGGATSGVAPALRGGATAFSAADSARSSPFTVLAWAAASAGLLLTQYVSLYDFASLGTEASFCTWLVLVALGCDCCARSSRGRGVGVWLLAAGACSATPWFARPSWALYSCAQLALIALCAPPPGSTRRAQFVAFGAGAGLACAGQFGFIAAFGSFAALARAYFVEGPHYYAFIGRLGVSELLAQADYARVYPFALSLALFAWALIAAGSLALRFSGFAALPLLGAGLALFAADGSAAALQPVSAGAAALAIALVCTIAEASRSASSGAASFWPLSLAAIAAFGAASLALSSPNLAADWAVYDGASVESRRSQAFAAHFERPGFPSASLVAAAASLQQQTRAHDRIQLYGAPPYLLVLAQRRSATPYLERSDLDASLALRAITRLGTPMDARFAEQWVARNRRDLATRVRRVPPAAFVLYDRMPNTPPGRADVALAPLGPELGPLLANGYGGPQRIGRLTIYLLRSRSSAP